MARRNELKSIASGILGSFNSRNNDISGYWGVGVINLHAQKCGAESIVFDLINQEIKPEISACSSVLQFYGSMLWQLVVKRKLDQSWLKEAEIVINYNQKCDQKYHQYREAIVNPYICSIKIVDDLGKIYLVTAGGNCRPHDPKRESRRNG